MQSIVLLACYKIVIHLKNIIRLSLVLSVYHIDMKVTNILNCPCNIKMSTENFKCRNLLLWKMFFPVGITFHL